MSKTVQVGRFDEPLREVVVDDNATVRQAFQIAGMNIESNEEVNSMSSQRIESGEVVRNGEGYLLVGNITLG